MKISSDLYIQIYENIRKPKKSYALIFNEKRIFGKDFVFGKWHRHPFENPDKHDESKIAQQAVSIDEFIEESFYIASERLEMV